MAKKKEKKMVSKKIRFGYFACYETVDSEILKQVAKSMLKLENAKEKKKHGKHLSPKQMEVLSDEMNIKNNYDYYDSYGRKEWDVNGMFSQLNLNIIDPEYSTNFIIDGMPIEIEPGSFSIDDNIVTFQLTKMRSDMLPATKKINTKKEDIKLDDDEYIGEFTSVLYDMKSNVFMIQSNMYGLTHAQVENYLTLLREKVLDKKEKSIDYTMCVLEPIVDTEDVFKKIRKSEEIKRIRLRAADGIIKRDGNNPFGGVSAAVGDKTGYVFDITISISRDSKTKSIGEEEVTNILDFLDSIKTEGEQDKNLLMEVTRKETEQSSTEIINLLKPCMKDDISVMVEERASIGHEFMADKMKEVFDAKKGKVYKNIGIVE